MGIGYLIGRGRPPHRMPEDVAQTVRAMSALRRILVPIRGFDFEQRAVELACRLGEDQNSQIILVFVLEVPLTIGLGTALPEAEERATAALACGARIVRAHGLTPVERVQREREAGRGILRAAQETQADLVVVGLDPNRGVALQPIGPATEALLRRAKFEVIIDRTPPRGFE